MNYNILLISFLDATNYKGARVKIKSERFEQSVIISFSYEAGNTLDTAKEWLRGKGFEIVGIGEGKDCYYIISSTFKPLK